MLECLMAAGVAAKGAKKVTRSALFAYLKKKTPDDSPAAAQNLTRDALIKLVRTVAKLGLDDDAEISGSINELDSESESERESGKVDGDDDIEFVGCDEVEVLSADEIKSYTGAYSSSSSSSSSSVNFSAHASYGSGTGTGIFSLLPSLRLSVEEFNRVRSDVSATL